MSRRSPTTRLRGLAVVVLVITPIAFVLTPGASGQGIGIGVAITPAFQDPVTVGQQDQPALIQVVNDSLGAVAGIDWVTLTSIRLNPACATSAVVGGSSAASPCSTPEPRPDASQPILRLDSPSVAGTTCPGGPFAISGPDAEGDYAFIPTSGPVRLAPVGQPGASCLIRFTFDVIQAPNDGMTYQSASLAATSPTFPGQVPQTGVSDVRVTVPPTTSTTTPVTGTTVAPTSTTTTVRVAVLPAVATTIPPRGGLAATGARDVLVPGLALMAVGALGLLAVRSSGRPSPAG